MLEGGALLARQDQTALCSTRQCSVPAALSNGMLPSFGHQFRRPLKPLLGVDHLARGEPLFAAPVLTEWDQIGRAAHRTRHLIKLLLAVAVAVDEAGKITIGERRLLVGDRIERDARVGNDARTVALGNGAVVFDPLGFKPAVLHARGGRADLVLRLKANALSLKAAVIDARINIELGKPLVDVVSPTLAPLRDQFSTVPVAHLRAEPVAIDLPHRQHHMRMRLGEAVSPDITMDIEIGNHAAIHKLGLNKVTGKSDALFLIELSGDRKLYLARQLRVLALLRCLDRVPQLLAVGEMLGRAFRQHHFGMNDTALVGEVMCAIDPLVMQPTCRAIGSSRHSAAPSRAADHFYGEVVDRHDGEPVTLHKPRRHDV